MSFKAVFPSSHCFVFVDVNFKGILRKSTRRKNKPISSDGRIKFPIVIESEPFPPQKLLRSR